MGYTHVRTPLIRQDNRNARKLHVKEFAIRPALMRRLCRLHGLHPRHYLRQLTKVNAFSPAKDSMVQLTLGLDRLTQVILLRDSLRASIRLGR